MDRMTAYISVRGSDNVAGMADVPSETMKMWQQHYGTPVVFDRRVPNTKWVALRWPNGSMAQMAGMSTAAFEDFYFDVCTADYKRMQDAAAPLVDLMEPHRPACGSSGRGTDLSFSIKGDRLGVLPRTTQHPATVSASLARCASRRTASCNTTRSSLNQGTEFKDIRFEVRTAGSSRPSPGRQTAQLNEILDTDEGGPGLRRVGARL